MPERYCLAWPLVRGIGEAALQRMPTAFFSLQANFALECSKNNSLVFLKSGCGFIFEQKEIKINMKITY